MSITKFRIFGFFYKKVQNIVIFKSNIERIGNEYEKNLLAKRYNENLTEIISSDITLKEFKYIFRVIVPKINYEKNL